MKFIFMANAKKQNRVKSSGGGADEGDNWFHVQHWQWDGWSDWRVAKRWGCTRKDGQMSFPKYPAKTPDFITLLCYCGWLRGKLHVSHPWIISLLLRSHHLALSYVPLFQVNAYIRFKCASLCEGSFLPARIHRRVKAMHRIKNLSCYAFIQHLLLLFSVSQLLPSTQRQQSFPRMPCTCPLAFIFLINMKAGTTCPSVLVENQNNWWLFDWPWPCP